MEDRSWADQWDTNPYSDPPPEEKKKKTAGGLVPAAWAKKLGKTAKYVKVGEEEMEKTKAAASAGAKKVKEGTSAGIQWIKDKCHKPSR
ncbi:uncharacterized protein LOC127246125 [Andrographis paniculata]|uniref:uncharacterized protein LOC127246125 n=1 Tax=Andrographis paniculata TaxID=175694 RepID=UPI0021E79992|nr:uncharacterized protein LOC127246125 [Andrographis paniculata]